MTRDDWMHDLRRVDEIKAIPAADVRPVVFCRDCKHRDPEDHKCDCGQLERAGCVFPVDDDYYCAYGVKRVMISCSKCKKATLPVSDGGCIKTGGIVDIGCEYGEPRIITNGDRIRAMTDEELADWLFQAWHQSWYTLQEWTDWLKEEVTND